MDQNSNSGGANDSVTPSTALLNQKLGISPAPRMLTASEIELLLRSKREIQARLRKRFEVEQTQSGTDPASCE